MEGSNKFGGLGRSMVSDFDANFTNGGGGKAAPAKKGGKKAPAKKTGKATAKKAGPKRPAKK